MRHVMGGPAFDELVESIRRDGVLVPVLLEQHISVFHVIAGHRRVMAARRVGLADIPSFVCCEGESVGWRGVFAENMFREDLSPMEEASALGDCLESGDMDVDGLARALGRSRDWVDGRLDMLKWPEDVQIAVHTGWLSVGAGCHLAAVTDAGYREQLLAYAHDNGASVRTCAAWKQAWEAGKGAAEAAVMAAPAADGGIQPVEPCAPCVTCGKVKKMVELQYPPVCRECGPLLLKIAAELHAASERGGGD